MGDHMKCNDRFDAIMQGRTPFIIACLMGNIDDVKLLLAAGANLLELDVGIVCMHARVHIFS